MSEEFSEGEEDAPTDRVVDLPAHTAPSDAGVLDPELAEQIRGEFRATMSEDDMLTFLGPVREDGSVFIPESMREARGIKPGDQLMVQATKVES